MPLARLSGQGGLCGWATNTPAWHSQTNEVSKRCVELDSRQLPGGIGGDVASSSH